MRLTVFVNLELIQFDLIDKTVTLSLFFCSFVSSLKISHHIPIQICWSAVSSRVENKTNDLAAVQEIVKVADGWAGADGQHHSSPRYFTFSYHEMT